MPTPSAAPISRRLCSCFLNAMADVRDVTRRVRILARCAITSSVMPSAKNSFSGSALMFTNGSTATEGRAAAAGDRRAARSRGALAGIPTSPSATAVRGPGPGPGSTRSARPGPSRGTARRSSGARTGVPARALLDRLRLLPDDGRHRLGRARPRERLLPRRHLVQDGAEGELVRTEVDRPAREPARATCRRPSPSRSRAPSSSRPSAPSSRRPDALRLASASRGRSRGSSRRPLGVTITFSGLRSRWTIPVSCASASAVGDLRAIRRSFFDRTAPRRPDAPREVLALDELHDA